MKKDIALILDDYGYRIHDLYKSGEDDSGSSSYWNIIISKYGEGGKTGFMRISYSDMIDDVIKFIKENNND